jgi:type I restriction enzyme S subunit
MDLSTFFQKFDQFADAPDAVAKLRELIMWAAFSGEFSGERRDRAMPSNWEMEGVPALPSIPSSWEWRRGRDVFDVIRGVSYKKDVASDAPVEGSFPLLRANNISKEINLDHLVYVPSDNIREEQFVRRGDILIAMSSGSKKLVGKAAPILTEFTGSFGAFCGVVRNKSAITDAVLARYFQSPQYTSWVTAAGRGIGINNLGKSDLDSLPVPIPPLAEQQRIVAKVDELMALCDRLEAQQQERESRARGLACASLARFAAAPTPANLALLFHHSFSIPPSDLRKSILTLAFAGKLVPQDPSDEPASTLLEKARAEKARLIKDGLVKKEPWAENLKDANTLYDLPTGWEWTHVSDVVEKVTVGFVGSMKSQYRDKGVPFLRCQNVRENRYEPVGLTFISEEFHRDIAKSTLRPGDVVVTRSGNVGVTCVIPDSLPEANCSDLVIVKRPLGLVPAFLSYFINSIAAGQIEAKTVGIALTHFNTQSVAQLSVALPPLAEQRRIVAKVEQLMALVDALEQQLAASRATAEKLLAALVAELTAT